MKFLIPILTLITFGCSSPKNQGQESESHNCNEERQTALENAKQQNLTYVLVNDFPRYALQLGQLLKSRNISLKTIGSFHGEGYCFKSTMDSLIARKHGVNFIKELENEADILFLDYNQGGIFLLNEVDSLPKLSSTKNLNFQEEIVDRLNNNPAIPDSINFVSNMIGNSYFELSFILSDRGEASNTEILEHNSTAAYTFLERHIINQINNSQNWTPAKIREQDISCSVNVSIAITQKENNANNR